MLAARLADFFYRVEARNAPPKSIFYFADLAQKLINFADLLKLAVSPSSESAPDPAVDPIHARAAATLQVETGHCLHRTCSGLR
jgi:hypothetical protein